MENDSIAANVKRIMEALPPGVILVAAAKARTPEEVEAALRAGVTHVGHNYIQEAERMMRQLAISHRPAAISVAKHDGKSAGT